MSSNNFARAVCNACDPGTSKKPYVVTVYAPDRREYVYFEIRSSAGVFMDRANKCQCNEDLDYLMQFYK